MPSFHELITKRRSIRKYTEQPLAAEHVEAILKAGLMSPTSKNGRSWQFLLVEDKEMLRKLAMCKQSGNKPIENCALAIVVMADPLTSDVWIEDASIASIMMQLQAEDLNIGSCWIQIRERFTTDDVPSDEYIRNLLDIPLQLQILSIITLGYKAQERPPLDEDTLQWEKIHIGTYKIQ